MQIFHIAEKSRWEAAKLAGSYAQSTYGRSLEDEGFIHASREDQWEAVLERYYSEATEPLVLLVIDTDLLTARWSEDRVGETTYPHVHGPINPAAVVAERPIPRRAAQPTQPTQPTQPAQPASQSFARLFLGEVVVRMVAGVVLMGLVVGGYYAARAVSGTRWAPLGLLVGLLVGLAIVIPAMRWRGRRIETREASRP